MSARILWLVFPILHRTVSPGHSLMGTVSLGAARGVIPFFTGRAVDCNELRKSLEMMYAQHLPKQSYPFIYLR